MRVVSTGERKKSLVVNIISFIVANLIFSLSFQLADEDLTITQTMFSSLCITAFVFSIYNLITFFCYNKFRIKLDEKEEK